MSEKPNWAPLREGREGGRGVRDPLQPPMKPRHTRFSCFHNIVDITVEVRTYDSRHMGYAIDLAHVVLAHETEGFTFDDE